MTKGGGGNAHRKISIKKKQRERYIWGRSGKESIYVPRGKVPRKGGITFEKRNLSR